jgi:ubiquinol-cytochrome c reductase cytochrome b subunit
MYEFGIEVSVKDVQLLYKIKNLLGVGSILFRYKERKEKDLEKINNMVIYRVRNKSHLKEIILPIFDKYPMLSSKQFDYIRFKSHLLSGVIYSKDLLHYNRPKLPINSMKNMINSYYFPA